MQCVIYKGKHNPGAYLFVERVDDFSRVPTTLMQLMGPMELVMTLDLASREYLAACDPVEVRQQLLGNGYFLQLPPTDYPTC